MALIKCLNCGEEYSDKVETCPHCGYEPKLFICTECNHLYKKDEKKCCYCGIELEPIPKIPATTEQIDEAYEQLLEIYSKAESLKDFEKVKTRLKPFESVKDTVALANEIDEKIKDITAKEEQEKSYVHAITVLKESDNIFECKDAIEFLKSIADYKDAAETVKKYIDEYTKVAYEKAQELFLSAKIEDDFIKAESLYRSILEYKDSSQKAEECISRISGLKNAVAKKKRIGIIAAITILVIVIGGVSGYFILVPKEVREVRNEIRHIGTITLDSKADLDKVEKDYENLDDDKKEAVKNYSTLQEDYETYYTLQAEDFDNQVMSFNSSVTADDYDAISRLVSDYDSLEEDAKKKVTTHETLLKLEEDCKKLKCDAVAAEILSYDYAQYDEMWAAYNPNKELLLKSDRLKKCVLHIGSGLIIVCASKAAKKKMINPSGFNLIKYSIDDLKDEGKTTAGAWEYSALGSICYSDINALGQSLTKTLYFKGFVYFNPTTGDFHAETLTAK